MPKSVAYHSLQNLVNEESKYEILLETLINTELHIIAKSDQTIIRFPFGNKFDVVDGMIIIHEK
jgi:hypothetical protein